MAHPATPADPRLAALPLPFRGVGIEHDVTTEVLPKVSDQVWGSRRVESDQRPSSRTQFAMIEVGAIACAVGRTSPLLSVQEQQDWVTIVSCHAGQPCYSEGRKHWQVPPGSVLAMPNHGGDFRSGYCSGVFFRVGRQNLKCAIVAISGIELDAVLVDPCVWPAQADGSCNELFGLFSLVDRLLSQDRCLPSVQGLDDQIHRLIAYLVLRQQGRATQCVGRHCDRLVSGRARLDDLVDWIRAQVGADLTLTDLQERSRYSARHLQALFRETFACTPMQFVRRQRLSLAMEKLESAGSGDTVTRIARACGYRHVSNFSADFLREFGLTPSQVLRGPSRARAGKKRGGAGLTQSLPQGSI